MRYSLLYLLCFLPLTSYAEEHFEIHSYLEGGINIIKGYNEAALTSTTFIPPIIPSSRRPSFEELGLHTDRYYSFGVDLIWDDYCTKLHYTHLTPSHHSTLNNELKSLDQTIAANQPFSMHTHYQWFNLALFKKYTLQSCLDLSAIVDINWVNYAYAFTSPAPITIPPSPTIQASREVQSALSMRVGAELAYKPGKKHLWTLTALAPLPYLPLAIYEAKLAYYYNMYEKNNFVIKPYIGMRWLLITLDSKSKPVLHARYEALPSLFAGLSFMM